MQRPEVRNANFGEQRPTEVETPYLGFSVACWEGRVLVIESHGLRDGTLCDDQGLPYSDALRLTQRCRLGKVGKMGAD